VLALATYDTMEPDSLSGDRRRNTGMTAIHLGPQIYLGIGEQFTLNAGLDIPIEIDNRDLQNVPDYRFHGGVTFSVLNSPAYLHQCGDDSAFNPPAAASGTAQDSERTALFPWILFLVALTRQVRCAE
jgi:hypothetical protein